MAPEAMKATDICARAAKITKGDRLATHGPTQKNHQNIAELWGAYLDIRRFPEAPISALDVAHMMILLKIARTHSGDTNLDDYVDIAGYAGVAGEIASEG